MDVFLGVLINYFFIGYILLKRELDTDISGHTPLVRDRRYLLYVFIWPLPLFANSVFIHVIDRQKQKWVADQQVKAQIDVYNNAIRIWLDSYGYGQRESVLTALHTIATKFSTTKATPGEIYFIDRLRKVLDVEANSPLYRQVLTRTDGHDFMKYLAQMSDNNKGYLCAIATEMLKAQPRGYAEKANIASAIFSDIGITKEQYRAAVSENNALFSNMKLL